MLKILKYSFYELLRSRWMYAYFGFYFLFTLSLLLLNPNPSKVILSLMNIILILSPLIATIFGVMYFYNSRDFIELLLAQPIKRTTIFWGQYLGLAISLSVSLLLGICIPFVFYNILGNGIGANFSMLLVVAVFLTFIFSSLAFLVALKNENKIQGFAISIGLWLVFALIYDGVFLLSLFLFEDYPLDNYSIAATLLNPIDLSRILLLLKLDISALMGYTGAVFQQFFGTNWGILIAFSVLFAWIAIPAWSIRRVAMRKDF